MSEVRELDETKDNNKIDLTVESTDSSSSSSSSSYGGSDNENENENDIDSVIGKKCSAPHTHLWGVQVYHNALICSVEREGQIRVLFTNPTHKEMIPCSFYLDGHCKFNDEKCRYSHGELVPYCDVKDYKEPDFSQLNVKSRVLVKQDDKLWHRGNVIVVNFETRTCKIRLEQKKQEIESDFEFIFPLSGGNGGGGDDNSDLDSEEENNEIRELELVERSLFTTPSDQILGKWEEHTKGIGSLLMYKMGYVTGTGLGKRGEGIIQPINAQILPPGRSLDHCMNLREQSNGDKNLFSVEKKLERIQRRQDKRNVKAYERGQQKDKKMDVFSFMNKTVFNDINNDAGDDQEAMTMKAVAHTPVVDIKKETNKNLNVASFQIAENIRKKEKEINVLEQSLKRHKSGTPVHVSIQSKLSARIKELNQLKYSETSIAREQNVRNNKSKLTIF